MWVDGAQSVCGTLLLLQVLAAVLMHQHTFTPASNLDGSCLWMSHLQVPSRVAEPRAFPASTA
jgi:hypothetical protein